MAGASGGGRTAVVTMHQILISGSIASLHRLAD
jgi:hypothetical protein